MAAFSLGRFLQTNHSSSSSALHFKEFKKPITARSKFSVVSCRSQGGKRGEKIENNNNKWWQGLMIEVKETLSPKQKGDWKDLVLMSFSFAVYVYISQRIVSAYCAWISTLKH